LPRAAAAAAAEVAEVVVLACVRCGCCRRTAREEHPVEVRVGRAAALRVRDLFEDVRSLRSRQAPTWPELVRFLETAYLRKLAWMAAGFVDMRRKISSGVTTVTGRLELVLRH
jgi:hypothetical protein